MVDSEDLLFGIDPEDLDGCSPYTDARGFLDWAVVHIEKNPYGLTAEEVVKAYLADGGGPGISENPIRCLSAVLSYRYASRGLVRVKSSERNRPYKYYPKVMKSK